MSVGEENYDCTKIEINSDISTLKDFFHKAIQKDPLSMFSLLLASNTADKQDIERDLLEILQEKPFNPAFLHLIERLLRLQPTDGMLNLSSLVKKPTMWFPNMSDTNRPVQAQKRARSLKRYCTTRVAKTRRALINCAVTAQLICVFVFALAFCCFSCAAAHL